MPLPSACPLHHRLRNVSFHTCFYQFGISYLGCVQWAAIGGVEQAKQAGKIVPRPVALVNIMSSSDVHRMCYSDNSFNLDLSMRYAAITNEVFGPVGQAKETRMKPLLSTIRRLPCLWQTLGKLPHHLKRRYLLNRANVWFLGQTTVLLRLAWKWTYGVCTG
jgi:hypothetical protein